MIAAIGFFLFMLGFFLCPTNGQNFNHWTHSLACFLVGTGIGCMVVSIILMLRWLL